ncbi:MAG: MBL fold metallo-hydrolase [Methanomassiliicoccaceae archaeon]|nr:MBL fold metallo-hydrolase [Methanomassiliicoccaceae archaeon]
MRIRWHGHACFEFISDENSIITDPHDGKSIGIKPPVSNANIVLISHDHFDHNASKIIKNEHIVLLSKNGKHNVRGIGVEGFSTFHDESNGSLRGENTIYKFTVDGISICHCGDLGDIPSEETLEALKNVDIIFVPTGEIYTLSIPKVIKFLDIIKPKIIVPMHYMVGGLSMHLKALDEYLDNVSKETVLYVGNEVELFSDDINEFKGIWVFER